MKKYLKILTLIFCAFICLSSQKILTLANERTPISIAMSLDDKYTYPTIVSMTSVLESANQDTCYDFYMLLSGNFRETYKQKLMSLQNKYKNCTVNLIDMKNAFKSARSDSRITTPAYYRLSLPGVLPDTVKKVIYLDGDTITAKDLTPMFNIDMTNYYVAGLSDYSHSYLKSFIKNINGEICSGVMLMNLEKMRHDNMEKKFSDFIKKNNKRLVMHDQTVINVMCYKHIFHLPAQYGLIRSMGHHANDAFSKNKTISSHYSIKELKNAYRDPAILHFAGKKPWLIRGLDKGNMWWDNAKKTDFFKEICTKYKR